MNGWLIALGMLVLLAILPVGVCLIYRSEGLILSLVFGLFKIKILPKEPKDKKKEKPKKEKKKKQKKPKIGEKHTEGKKKSGGKVTDFIPLLKVALRLLNSFRRKLRVGCLELNYVMAGGDPCDLALNYGKGWEAVGVITPYLDSVFVIRKKKIQVQCDFAAQAPTIYAKIHITITVGRVVGVVFKYGAIALWEFLKIKNKRKGGATK